MEHFDMTILSQDDARPQTENQTSADFTPGEVFKKVAK